MSSLFHILLIPITLIATAITLKSSGMAISRKYVDFVSLDEQIQKEIGKCFQKTLTRLSEFDVTLPAKIMIYRMANEKGNTFNEPFLVGNTHEVKAFHYVSDTISEWCSGLEAPYTQDYFEYKNRRIDVLFDCNREMALPPLRTIIGWILGGLATVGAIIVLKASAFALEEHLELKKLKVTIADDEKPTITFDDYITDDVIDDLTFSEKWDASKVDSCSACYDILKEAD
uniref:DUF3592 domain-containing protein n=1 Tax=Caenorhabditis tropicalis TaxID=1561998 RepID=A0A1I7T6H6_9PELO